MTKLQSIGGDLSLVAGKAIKSALFRSKKHTSIKGLSINERRNLRRERIRAAGMELYGRVGFFNVKIKDICQEAQLTERYFYESFTNADALFLSIYNELVEYLQQKILLAVLQAGPDPVAMARAGLTANFTTIRDDFRMARILFIDAIHVKSLGSKTIHETMAKFDHLLEISFKMLNPGLEMSATGSYLATGFNGFSAQMALRWVGGGLTTPLEDLVDACMLVYKPFLESLREDEETKRRMFVTNKSS